MPLSLLWGVAFAESSFDPSKVGPYTRSGERALGLMQLMPPIAAKYGVAEPMDATQNALGAAKYLLALAKPLKWDASDMLTAYNWGPTAYARARAAGQATPGDVQTYVRRALAAREVYRNKADKPIGTLTSALNAAIESLAALNPTWAPATMARDAWRPYYAKHQGDNDLTALAVLPLAQWRNYELAYERAPITDESTPRPELVKPDLWRAAVETIDSVKHSAEQATYGLGAGLFVLALFLLAVADRRR